MFRVFLVLILGTFMSANAFGMSVQGLTASGVIDSQKLETDHQLPTFPEASESEISSWVGWWDNYSSQFTPKSYRRDVIGDACAAEEKTFPPATRTASEHAKIIACRQHYRLLFPETAEEQLQELAETVNIGADDQPYFCVEQYPHPSNGRRCIPKREFNFTSGWIHTKVDRASVIYPDTHISYAVESGPCTITVGGVITPTDGGVCVVKAIERFNAGLSRDSNVLELTIVDDRCHDADVPFVLTAAQQQGDINVPVQLTASGGGLAACQAGHSNHIFFVTPTDRCSLNYENQLTATLPGECAVTAYASGLINESFAQRVTVSFSDPDAANRTALELTVEASHVGRDQNIVATISNGLHVNATGAYEYGLVVQGSSCGTATALENNRYEFGPRDHTDSATCRIYATNGARQADGLFEQTEAVCITIGAGGTNVPEGCEGTVAPAEFASYGDLTIECSGGDSDNTCHRASGSLAIINADDVTLNNFTLRLVSDSANENCAVDSAYPHNVRRTNVNQPAACHVEAVREGNTSNALCVSFGDMTITDRDSCTGEASSVGFNLAVSNSEPEIGESVTITLTTDRAAVGNEQILLRMASNYPGCSQEGSFFASGTDTLQTAVTCTEDQGAPLPIQFVGEFLEQTQTINITYQSESSADEGEEEETPTDQAYTADDGPMSLTLSSNTAALDERVTLTANNAGSIPRWRISRLYSTVTLLAPHEDSLSRCEQFSSRFNSEGDLEYYPTGVKELSARYYDAICQVTLEHDDDADNQITRCVRFGEISDSTFAQYCPNESP